MSFTLPHTRQGIAAVSQLYGLTPRALRYYESIGLIHPHRDRYHQRTFSRGDCAKIAWISALRAAGIGLAEVREIVEAEDRVGLALEKLAARRGAITEAAAAVDRLIEQIRPAPQRVRRAATAA